MIAYQYLAINSQRKFYARVSVDQSSWVPVLSTKDEPSVGLIEN